MPSAATPLPIDVPRAEPGRGFRRWLRTHRGATGIAGLLAFAGPLTFFTGALAVVDTASAAELAQLASWWMFYGASFWCLLLVAGYTLERAGRHVGPTARAGLWLLGAALVAGMTNLMTAGRASILIEQGLVHSARTMHLHGFTFALIMALLYFAYLRRSRGHEQAAARLAAAQAAQRHARHRIVQARLQEVQARIDPRVLFEMLEALRGLYERDPVQAERFLDELIAFLRAALPRLRDTSSSLLREVELARTFVGLRQLAGAPGGDLAVEISPEVRHARFPPGVLLPLLDGIAGQCGSACRLVAARSAEACRVALTVGARPSDASIERVGGLLVELYGKAARLEIGSGPAAVDIVLQVPYELA